MVIKQRQSVFDGFLLRVVLPYVHQSHFRPLMHIASLWHHTIREAQAGRKATGYQAAP